MVDERKEYKNLVKKGKEDRVLPKEKGYDSFVKLGNKVSKVHAPSISGNRSYKAGNPLKKVLAHKGTTVKVSGSKERTNLMRASW